MIIILDSIVKNNSFSYFVLDASFKRVFWTVSGATNGNKFPVYTCDSNFNRCYDTSIRLPSMWPFSFFNVRIFYLRKNFSY